MLGVPRRTLRDDVGGNGPDGGRKTPTPASRRAQRRAEVVERAVPAGEYCVILPGRRLIDYLLAQEATPGEAKAA